MNVNPLGVWNFKNLDIVIFSDTRNVTKVRLCIVVLPIELDLLIPLSVTLAVFQGHSSVTVSAEKFLFLYD